MKKLLKLIILLLITVTLFIVMFGIFECFDRSFENRCDYWETLPFPTDYQKSLCPNHF